MDQLGQGSGFGHVRQSSQPWQALALVCSVKVVRDVVATACAELTVPGDWGLGTGDRGGDGDGDGGRLLPRSMSRARLRFGGLNPVDRAL